MNDRFKFRAVVKGYYYIDTPEKCAEFEPLIFLERVDVLEIGEIGINEDDLEISIRKQCPDIEDVHIERIMENFRDNSNGIDSYITIAPKAIYQCTGLKDKNGILIYEGDIVTYEWLESNGRCWRTDGKVIVEWKDGFTVISNIADYKVKEGTSRNVQIVGNVYENPELLEV